MALLQFNISLDFLTHCTLSFKQFEPILEKQPLFKENTMVHPKTVKIHDPVFEETYTAHIQKNGTNWLGWIPEVPEVKCEELTEKVVLKTLETKLHESLEAEEEAWEKQFETDVKPDGWTPSLRKPHRTIEKANIVV